MSATGSFDVLEDEARRRTQAKQTIAVQRWGLGETGHFHLDLAHAKIWFGDDDAEERIEADVQFAGSWAPASESWLWGQDNEGMPEVATARLAAVTEYGRAHGLELLDGAVTCSEGDAWSLAAIAAHLCDAEAVYVVPRARSKMFLLLFAIRRVPRAS